MKINMSQEEMITKKAIKAAVTNMQNKEISKGACIRELFAGGLSVKEIAAETGILYNHVYNVCNNEVLKNHLEVDVIREREGGTKKEAVLELLQQGKSITEVSKTLGCLYNQVWQIAKAAGYTNKQKAAVAKAEQ